MSTSTALALLPTVPSDVEAFAAEHGISAILPTLVALTRQIFPEAPMSLSVYSDAVYPEWQQILIEVKVPDYTVDEYLDWYRRWAGELFAHCPSTHAHLFGLDVEPA
jgi:hypothetical protein